MGSYQVLPLSIDSFLLVKDLLFQMAWSTFLATLQLGLLFIPLEEGMRCVGGSCIVPTDYRLYGFCTPNTQICLCIDSLCKVYSTPYMVYIHVHIVTYSIHTCIIILLFYCTCIVYKLHLVSNEVSETLQVPWVATPNVCVSRPAFYWLGDRKQEV